MSYSQQLINFKQKGGLRKGKSQKGFYARLSSTAYAKDRKAKLKHYKMNDWEVDPASYKKYEGLIRIECVYGLS
jgi:hypothetical protein